MDKLWDEIKTWQPLNKMEDASGDILEERINTAYNIKMPHSIELVPYVGGGGEVVQYKTEELIALCPVTFLPDFYKLTIRYQPSEWIPELKSLKLYLGDYIMLPISHEHLADKIHNYFLGEVYPSYLYIKLEVAIRGGISTTVEVGDEI